jgi:hypothetical protein
MTKKDFEKISEILGTFKLSLLYHFGGTKRQDNEDLINDFKALVLKLEDHFEKRNPRFLKSDFNRNIEINYSKAIQNKSMAIIKDPDFFLNN